MDLKGIIELSGDASSEVQIIEQAREETNVALSKGVQNVRPSEVSQITKVLLEGKELQIEITSGLGIRATDVLLRFKNLLAKKLGAHKIGIRRITVQRLTLTSPPGDLDVAKVRALLGKSARVTEDPNQVTIEIKDIPERDLHARVIENLLKSTKSPNVSALKGKATFGAVLKNSEPRRMLFREDPSIAAEARDWIIRFPGKGQWLFGPPMLSLVRAVKEIIEEDVCRPLGFKEWMFPRLLPMEVYSRLKTYVEHLPEGVFYVCAPPRNPAAFDEFKKEYTLRGVVRTDILKNILDEPSYVLDAVQCPPFYQAFANKKVPIEDLPVRAYDVMSGWTWRNEAGGTEGLVRTNEFFRMEMVFMDSPDNVQKLRDLLVDKVTRVVGEELGLEWRLVAGAPFYLSPDEARTKVIDISSLDKIPTLDVECYLPYRGERDLAEWLEISAGTVHRTFYVDAFKIRDPKRRPIWTGCLGHGITRWAAAILSQYGLEFDDWPNRLKTKIQALPQPVKRR